MRFRESYFAKWIARILSFPFHVLAFLFVILCFSLDSDNKILLYISLSCGEITTKLIDIAEKIYTICGWYYGYRWFF